jgi:hypothetical protein
MHIDLADQPLFHTTDAMFDPYPMSDTEEPDQWVPESGRSVVMTGRLLGGNGRGSTQKRIRWP